MKNLLCVILLSTLTSSLYSNTYAGEFTPLQFPDANHNYQPGKDTGFSKYLTKSLRGTRKISLTFDDGPDVVNTPRLLDILAKYNTKATFFIQTEKLNQSTTWIIERMISEGHTVASHHHDHGNSNAKTKVQYKTELKKSFHQLATKLDDQRSENPELYYRFPYGNYGSASRDYHHMNVMKEVSRELFGDNCINFVFWDIDTIDWVSDMTEKDIIQTVIANIDGGASFDFKKNSNGTYSKNKYMINNPIGGGVVLMHDVHKKTIDSVEGLLLELQRRKIEILKLQDIQEFSYKGLVCRLLMN